MPIRSSIPLLFATVFISGCSDDAGQASTGNATASAATATASNEMMAMGTAAPNPSDPPATQGYKQSMSDMMANMPAFTGKADVDFMRQMKVHHGSAIAMARVELRHGTDAQARALAEKIIRDQRAEIAEIDAWLSAGK